MNKYYNPPKSIWKELIKRPAIKISFINKTIDYIFNLVQKKGDDAIRLLTKEFDKIDLIENKISKNIDLNLMNRHRENLRAILNTSFCFDFFAVFQFLVKLVFFSRGGVEPASAEAKSDQGEARKQ